MTALGVDARTRWATRMAVFGAGGGVGAALVWLVLERLPDVTSPAGPLVVGTAVVVPAVGLPLWRVVVRPPRAGPWWGGLVAAWIPALLTAALALIALAVGDLTVSEVGRAAALLYLTTTPLTGVLAAVGAGLATWIPRRQAA